MTHDFSIRTAGVLVILVALLGGCAGTNRVTGGPSHRVDLSTIESILIVGRADGATPLVKRALQARGYSVDVRYLVVAPGHDCIVKTTESWIHGGAQSGMYLAELEVQMVDNEGSPLARARSNGDSSRTKTPEFMVDEIMITIFGE